MELKTTVFYKAGGTTYTFPFEYLQKNFVKVRYQKPDASYVELEYEKDYTITEDTVNLMAAGSADDIINIYRSTPTDRLVKYVDASILKAHDMNVDELQTLHIMEEQTDYLTSYALFKADKANRWNARQLRLTNVALPQEPTDAVNKAYVDEYGVKWDQNVAQMKKQLEDQDAKINKQMDDKDAAWAKQLKDQSDSFVALISEHDANQRAEVDAQVEQAKKWAVSAESPDGTEGAKSSKTWAEAAKVSRQGALDSENKAKASATESAASAANAKASETASATSEAHSKASEVNAKASEVAAAESAKHATTGQINTDWNETNADSKAFIKNKPDVAIKSDLDALKATVNNGITTKALTVSGETSVPTANEGNSSSTIANTEFVAKSLAKMVDSAPESLNTLNELAKALGNDPNFATTIVNELAKKLNSAEAESTYVKQGGINLWNALHNNNTSNLNGLTNKQWNDLGFFIRYFEGVTAFENQPGPYGQLINIAAGDKDSATASNESTQLFIEQNTGKLFFRGGNGIIAIKDVKFKEVAYWNDNKHLVFPNGAEMWVD